MRYHHAERDIVTVFLSVCLFVCLPVCAMLIFISTLIHSVYMLLTTSL